MKTFMIGGTGLLGSEAAKVLIKRGHEVTAIALPPLPTGAEFPQKMKIEFGNIIEMSDDEVRAHLQGSDGFIFAAGVDERVEGPPPIYDFFKKYNIDPVKRWLRIAKEVGLKHTVILGSYFVYFNTIWPEKELAKWHPYIRSRQEQEDAALSFADEAFDVAVLELPYIFGTQPGRKPVWLFLVEILRNMKKVTLYPKGGTTMVTVHQVAEAIAGALERNKGGKAYPIGYYNMTWKEMLKIFHKYMGEPDRKIITIPTWLFNLNSRKMLKEQRANNIEGGLDLSKLADIQCANTFIDKSLGCEMLGVQPDDINTAIGDSVKLCLNILDNQVETIGMKAE